MTFSDLNLTRNWFLSFAYDMSNEAKDSIRDLNSYVNSRDPGMQLAIGCLHDCYYALDSLIDLVEDNTKNIEVFVSDVSYHKVHLIEDVNKLSTIINHPSIITINEVKNTVSNVLKKVELLGSYAELEDNSCLMKDENGNLKEITAFSKFLKGVEAHPILSVAILIILIASVSYVCNKYGFDALSNFIEYLLKTASAVH